MSRTVLLAAITSLAVSICTASYVYTTKTEIQRPRLAVVDLALIVSNRTKAKLSAIAAAQSSDQTAAARFEAEGIGVAIGALAQECKCALLLKDAVVSSEFPDLTHRLSLLMEKHDAQHQ